MSIYWNMDIDIEFIRNRITELRMKKGVSEYKMSLDMGHSKSYVQSISSGKSVPSLPEFLYICDYLGVTPSEFFRTDIKEPQQVHVLLDLVRDLSHDDMELLLLLANRLKNK